ncbi:MAG: mechanosensitive ion channel domain-containing protein [Evtepia sp.]
MEIGSTGGTIREIGMVYTKLATLDNRIILMPNNVVVDRGGHQLQRRGPAPGGPGGDGRLRRAGGAG